MKASILKPAKGRVGEKSNYNRNRREGGRERERERERGILGNVEVGSEEGGSE